MLNYRVVAYMFSDVIVYIDYGINIILSVDKIVLQKYKCSI